MEKIVRIVKMGEDDSNLLYWLSLSYADRLNQLEQMRKQINEWKYGPRQKFQRVYRIVKRA